MMPEHHRRIFVPGGATITKATDISLRSIAEAAYDDPYVHGLELDMVTVESENMVFLACLTMFQPTYDGDYTVMIVTDGEYWSRSTFGGHFFIPTQLELTEGDQRIINNAIKRVIEPKVAI